MPTETRNDTNGQPLNVDLNFDADSIWRKPRTRRPTATPTTIAPSPSSDMNDGQNASSSSSTDASGNGSTQIPLQDPQLKLLFDLVTKLSEKVDSLQQQQPSAAETLMQQRAAANRQWEAASRASRRQAYIDQGLTEAQVNEAMNENPFSNSVSHPTTLVSTSQPKRYTFYPDNIGYFDGNPHRLEFWISRVASLWRQKVDPNWREPLLETLPQCLRDSAARWYELHSATSEEEQDPRSPASGSNAIARANRPSLKSWPDWEKSLRDAFGMDVATQRRYADGRTWLYVEEEISTYFYDKYASLRAAYPGHADQHHASDIWLGLPNDFQIIIRSCTANNPDPMTLLREMRIYETAWRNCDPKRRALRTKQNATPSRAIEAAPSTTAPSMALTTFNKQPTTSTTAGGGTEGRERQSLKDTYNPSMIKVIKGVRYYTLPNGGSLKLKRPCEHCKQDHFGFEHEFLSKKTPAPMVALATPWSFGGYDVVQLGYDLTDDDDVTDPSAFTLSPSISSPESSFSADSSNSGSASPASRFRELEN